MNPTPHNLIDAYLRDELSGEKLASFENLMSSDPSFRGEVRFEEQVKEGISRYRKAELKSRLNAIEVSPAYVGGQWTGWAVKTLGGLIATGVIITAAYFWMDAKSEDDSAVGTKSDTVPSEEYPKEENVADLILPDIDEAATSTPAITTQAERISEKPDNRLITSSTNELPEAPVEEEFAPEVVVPGLNEVESEEINFATELEVPEASASDEINANLQPLDVKTVNRNTEAIRYKYYDGKLYLYGDFKKQPYEILEINKSSERDIFVYHNASYYKVELTDKVEELPQITNDKLIRELEILRNNKLAE